MEFKTKENVQSELHQALKVVNEWLSAQNEEEFNKVFVEDKWTTGQHIYHLIKSTKPITNALKLPKIALKMKFGTMNRDERSYEEMKVKYHDALGTGIKAPANFAAVNGRILDKTEMLERFSKSMIDLGAQLGKWNEKDLSTYVLPHPAIGKCSLREMGVFTVLHTYHHLDILKRDYR